MSLGWGLQQTTAAIVLAGPITNPANGQSYYLLSPDTWNDSPWLQRTSPPKSPTWASEAYRLMCRFMGSLDDVRIYSRALGDADVATLYELESEPRTPSLAVEVASVKVTLNVVTGLRYLLEDSADLKTWSAAEPEFTAEATAVVRTFNVEE